MNLLENLEIENKTEIPPSQEELEATMEWNKQLLSINQRLQSQLEKQTEYIKTLNDVEKIYSDNAKLKSQNYKCRKQIEELEKKNETLILTCDEKVKEILDACTADNELAEKNRAKYEELLAREEELIQSTINDKTSEIESQLEEQFKLEIKKKKSLMDKKYKTIEIMDEWVLIFCSIWSVVQAIVNKWIRADLIEIALILRGIIVKCFSYIVKFVHF